MMVFGPVGGIFAGLKGRRSKGFIILSFGLLVVTLAAYWYAVVFPHQRDVASRFNHAWALLAGPPEDRVEGIVLYQLLLQRKSDTTIVIKLLERVARECPDPERQAQAYLLLGEAFARLGSRPAAVRAYRKVISDYPEFQIYRTGAEIGIKEILTDGKTRSGDPALRMYITAHRLRRMGEYHEAIGLYQRFVDEYPNHKLARIAAMSIGDIYLQLGRDKEAEAAWRKVIWKYPDSPDASLAAFYIRSLHEPKSREQLREALMPSQEKSALRK